MNGTIAEEPRNAVDALLDESNRVAQAGAYNAALLLTWGAAEAAIQKVTGERQLSASLLVTYAFNCNLIDQDEYTFLLTILRKCKNVSHGTEQADSTEVQALTILVREIAANGEQRLEYAKQQSVREIVGEEQYEYFPLGEYVVRAPGVCGGRPTFKYTRIEAEGALQRLAAGEEFAHVVAGYSGRVSGEALQEAIDIRARPLLDASITFATA